MIKSIFNYKKVLVTGHTGFKGSWLVAWLKQLGAKVTGIGLDPFTTPSNYIASKIYEDIGDYRINICEYNLVEQVINDIKPDFLFHLAAQALVSKSYANPRETWQTNLIGTLNIIESLKKMNTNCNAVFITSDKCYDNVEWVWGYRENDRLGGPDPYSASKGAAELLIKSEVKSFFQNGKRNIRVATARAGNVIGGGDWSIDRIVPDCIKAWSNDEIVSLRNPYSTRPWQHVLEPLSGYLLLASQLSLEEKFHGESFNFGPQSQQNKSVLELVVSMQKMWKKVKYKIADENKHNFYESGLLKLNCDKALHLLGWHAVMDFEQTVNFTSEWYKNFYNNIDISLFTMMQINKYREIATDRGLVWTQLF